MKYLQLNADGGNGFRRGVLLGHLPPGVYERNSGEGIWEGPDGPSTLYVEIRDESTCGEMAEELAMDGEFQDPTNGILMFAETVSGRRVQITLQPAVHGDDAEFRFEVASIDDRILSLN